MEGATQAVGFRRFSVSELEHLSSEALQSADPDARTRASAQLRPLCHFEQWDELRGLLHNTRSPYAIFIIAKSIGFIVQNEVGPSERLDMQVFLLEYISRNQQLPKYLVRSLMNVYASAAHLNWRTMILQQEEDRPGVAATQRMLGQLRLLAPHHRIIAIEQIVEIFTKEHTRTVLRSIHESFAAEGLPVLFQLCADLLDGLAEEVATHGPLQQSVTQTQAAALEACCQCLELPPLDSWRPLVQRYTTEDSVYLLSMNLWTSPLEKVFRFCAAHVSFLSQSGSHPEPELLPHCVRYLTLLSTIDFHDVMQRELLVQPLLQCCEQPLATFANAMGAANTQQTTAANATDQQQLPGDVGGFDQQQQLQQQFQRQHLSASPIPAGVGVPPALMPSYAPGAMVGLQTPMSAMTPQPGVMNTCAGHVDPFSPDQNTASTCGMSTPQRALFPGRGSALVGTPVPQRDSDDGSVDNSAVNIAASPMMTHAGTPQHPDFSGCGFQAMTPAPTVGTMNGPGIVATPATAPGNFHPFNNGIPGQSPSAAVASAAASGAVVLANPPISNPNSLTDLAGGSSGSLGGGAGVGGGRQTPYLLHDTDELASRLREFARVIINVFERSEDAARDYLRGTPQFTHNVCVAMFHAINAPNGWDPSDFDELRATFLTLEGLIVRLLRGRVNSWSPEFMEIDSGICAQVHGSFKQYFEAVISKCHLKEESPEIQKAEAMQLVMETQLRPVAGLVLFSGAELAPVIASTLQEAIALHDVAVRGRNGEQLSQSDIALISNTVGSGCDPLTASRVALSRVSVVVSTVALVLVHNGSRGHSGFYGGIEEQADDMNLLMLVVGFARSFISEDLTEVLMCMSLNGATGGQAQSTLHIGIMRALLHFIRCVARTPLGEQNAFTSLAGQVARYVLSQHSAVAPVLVQDCITVLDPLFTDESHSRILIEACAPIIDDVLTGRVALVSPAAVGMAQTGPMQDTSAACVSGDDIGALKRRKGVMKTLARLLELRYRIGLDRSTEKYDALLQLVSQPLCAAFSEDVQRAATDSTGVALGPSHVAAYVAFCYDVRGLVAATQTSSSLLRIIAWLQSLKGEMVAAVRLLPHKAFELLKSWSKVARSCKFNFTEDLMSPLPTATCSLMFDCLQFALASRANASGVGGSYTVSAEELACISVMLDSVLSAQWCNVGVMIYYGDNSIPKTILEVVRKISSLDASEVMSLVKKRDAFFTAITAVFDAESTLVLLRQDANFTEHVHQLGNFVISCLQLFPMDYVVTALDRVFALNSAMWTVRAPAVPLRLFDELCVQLATGSAPGDTVGLCCGLVDRTHACYPQETEAVLERLLDQCSAFHRVRLRCLLMLLRNPPDDLAAAYSGIFGKGASTVAHQMSGW